MERIWAPWRMEFIAGEKEEDCLFCNRIQRDKDCEDLILERGKNSFTLLNKYPYSHGHLMVVPYCHTDDLGGLDAETSAELLSSLGQWMTIMRRDLKAQGFNVGINLGAAAGAGVQGHVHFHLVPRWVGDTNFMPALAETKVLPEHLNRTYERLRQAREEL